MDGQTTETIGIIANMIGNYLQNKIVINVPGVARGICKSSIIRQLTTSYGEPGDMPAILCYLEELNVTSFTLYFDLLQRRHKHTAIYIIHTHLY